MIDRLSTIHQARILVGEIARPPRVEVLAQTPHESRHRIFRQRSAAQQRRQRAFDATGFPRRNLFLVAWLPGTVLIASPPAPAAKRAQLLM